MTCNFLPSYFPVDESNERSAERLNEPQVSEMEDFESLFAQVDIRTNCIFLFKNQLFSEFLNYKLSALKIILIFEFYLLQQYKTLRANQINFHFSLPRSKLRVTVCLSPIEKSLQKKLRSLSTRVWRENRTVTATHCQKNELTISVCHEISL
jgi:hypothetical protein